MILKNNYFQNKVLSNSIFSLAQQGITLLINLLIFSIIGKHFGPIIFGQYSFATTISSFIALPLALGINIPIYRAIAKKNKKANVYLINGLILRYIGMLILLPLLTLMVAYLMRIDYLALTSIVAWYVGLNSIFSFYQGSFLSLNKTAYNFILTVILKLMQLAVVYLVLNDFTKLFIFFNCLILINIFFAHYTLNKFIPINLDNLKGKINYRFACKLIIISFPLIISAFSEFLNLKIDQLFLGLMTTEKTLGLYSSATYIYFALTLLPLTLTQVFFTNFIMYFHTSAKSAFKFFNQYMSLFGFYSFLMILLIYITSDQIINFMYGKDFILASKILFILSFSIPFVIMNRLSNAAINALGFYSYTSKIILIGSLINIALNIILIPYFNAYGAVYATIFTEAIVLLLGLAKINIEKNKILKLNSKLL